MNKILANIKNKDPPFWSLISINPLELGVKIMPKIWVSEHRGLPTHLLILGDLENIQEMILPTTAKVIVGDSDLNMFIESAEDLADYAESVSEEYEVHVYTLFPEEPIDPALIQEAIPLFNQFKQQLLTLTGEWELSSKQIYQVIRSII